MKTKTLLACLCLCACGSESSDSNADSANKTYEQYAPKEETEDVTWYVELPKCNARKEEKLVYIPQDDEFLVCRSGKWTYLDQNPTCSSEPEELTTVNTETQEE